MSHDPEDALRELIGERVAAVASKDPAPLASRHASDVVVFDVQPSSLAVTPPGKTLQAAKLAEFYEIPPAYLAKHLQALARSGIIQPAYGKGGGYRLARPPDTITALAVVLAIDGDEPAFRCTEIRRKGPTGLPDRYYTEACGFTSLMWEAEQAWRDHLASVTLADVVADLPTNVHPEQQHRARVWITTNARPR